MAATATIKRSDAVTQSQPLDITLGGLLKAVVPVMTVVALIGGLPTWRLTGLRGVSAQAVAVCGVAAVMLLSGRLTVWAARRSARDAFIVFLGSSVARVIACPAVVFVAGWMLNLPIMPMSVWLAITYLLCLITECVWIVSALKKHVEKYKPTKTFKPIQPKYMDWSI